jgi:uncharacterized protein (UPF0335 family)
MSKSKKSKSPSIGHNSNGALDASALKSYVSRLVSIEDEIADLSEDRKSVYAEAELAGLDKRALKEIVRVTRLEEEKKAEWMARRETIGEYLASLGDLATTELGKAAMRRDGAAGLTMPPLELPPESRPERRRRARAVPACNRIAPGGLQAASRRPTDASERRSSGAAPGAPSIVPVGTQRECEEVPA